VAIDSDNRLSLPDPPPPRPAARKEAIEAALRKFDGIAETPAARRSSWLGMDRRAFGALATAAIVAVISVPIALDALRDLPQPPQQAQPPVVADVGEPALEAPSASDNLAASKPAADHSGSAVVAKEEPTPEQLAEARQVEAKRERIGLIANEQATRSEASPPAVAVAAPPPPPPPPPPAPAAAPAARSQQYAADSAAQEIAVTGSRIPQPNLESAAPLKAIDASGDFLSRLQVALKANDRRAVSRLVGLPLSVMRDGRVETYRSRREVERDFDEIFTPRVRSEVLNQRPYSLRTREDGKTKGSMRLWFAPACFNAECNPPGQIRIREVTP
jgi:hypothetical protein